MYRELEQKFKVIYPESENATYSSLHVFISPKKESLLSKLKLLVKLFHNLLLIY